MCDVITLNHVYTHNILPYTIMLINFQPRMAFYNNVVYGIVLIMGKLQRKKFIKGVFEYTNNTALH